MSNDHLLDYLLCEKTYDHPISHLKLVETHVSWIILTGEYAYKIKKPVNFEFLDFSSLEKRKYYCEEELRLGQQLSPEIYLSVVSIVSGNGCLKVNGQGPIIEWAVKMREFPQENLFSNLLKQKRLTDDIIKKLARLIAEFHNKTSVAPKKSHFGQNKEVHAPVIQNFKQIQNLITNKSDIESLERLENFTNQQYIKYRSAFKKRKKQGFIRECHGDLHLSNIILYRKKPVLFDRLEFNDTLRWTDVISDIAFLMMDLMEKKRPCMSRLFLNVYLNHTGDYQGISVLPYYLSYRAVVRAKIALFRLNQTKNQNARREIKRNYRNFIRIAESCITQDKQSLVIMYGLSGSGKTTHAKNIARHCGAIHINSDIIRKRLFNVPLDSNSHSKLNSGIYTAEATQKTYRTLVRIAKIILKSNSTVIVDATFLKRKQRILFYKLSKQLKVPFHILHCQENKFEIKRRVVDRLRKTTNISEADLNVIEDQQIHSEPLTKLEERHTLLLTPEKTSLKKIYKTIFPKISHNHHLIRECPWCLESDSCAS